MADADGRVDLVIGKPIIGGSDVSLLVQPGLGLENFCSRDLAHMPNRGPMGMAVSRVGITKRTDLISWASARVILAFVQAKIDKPPRET